MCKKKSTRENNGVRKRELRHSTFIWNFIRCIKLGVPKVVKLDKIDRGCSCIVDCVNYDGRRCIEKKLFPLGLFERKILLCKADGRIIRQHFFVGWRLWLEAKIRFFEAFYKEFFLQNDMDTAPYIVHVQSLYIGNGTMYMLTEGIDGKAWNQIVDDTVEQILIIGCQIADLCHRIHQKGWLIVDIKASNFLISKNGGIHVKLADFDSFIPLKRCNHVKCYNCSSETASIEFLYKRYQHVGIQSDVYGLMAMLLYKLSGTTDRHNVKFVLEKYVQPQLMDWKKCDIDSLFSLFLHSLDINPKYRPQNCKSVCLQLGNILKNRGVDYEDLLS